MIRALERPRGTRPSRPAAALCALAAATVVACGSEEAPADTVPPCLEAPADGDCTQVAYGMHNGQIAPTFSEIFSRTLQPSCGTTASCHAAPGQNGLALDDEATAYADLMAKNAAGTTSRVIPNDLKCGELVVRLETPNQTWSMPQGAHLPDNLLCVIRHWIANGAQP